MEENLPIFVKGASGTPKELREKYVFWKIKNATKTDVTNAQKISINVSLNQKIIVGYIRYQKKKNTEAVVREIHKKNLATFYGDLNVSNSVCDIIDNSITSEFENGNPLPKNFVESRYYIELLGSLTSSSFEQRKCMQDKNVGMTKSLIKKSTGYSGLFNTKHAEIALAESINRIGNEMIGGKEKIIYLETAANAFYKSKSVAQETITVESDNEEEFKLPKGYKSTAIAGPEGFCQKMWVVWKTW